LTLQADISDVTQHADARICRNPPITATVGAALSDASIQQTYLGNIATTSLPDARLQPQAP
jgi:hypothetical protein